jgi:hypothetical protein
MREVEVVGPELGNSLMRLDVYHSLHETQASSGAKWR